MIKYEVLNGYMIPHLLHNNICLQLRERPGCNTMPEKWPNEIKKSYSKGEKTRNNSDTISFNINILLNLAALVENSLESLLIGPLAYKNNSMEIANVTIDIIKKEIINISSLEKYFDFYKKIYQKKVKEIISKREVDFFILLFDIRNMIIHCSSLSAKWIKEDDYTYIYVDDNFYQLILNNVRQLFKTEEDYYCLPEQLLTWNYLVDNVLVNVLSAVEKLILYSKNIYNYIEIPFGFYSKNEFINIIKLTKK